MVWAPLIIEEPRQEGIPAFGEQNKGYFQATGSGDHLISTQVIDNPRQDIPWLPYCAHPQDYPRKRWHRCACVPKDLLRCASSGSRVSNAPSVMVLARPVGFCGWQMDPGRRTGRLGWKRQRSASLWLAAFFDAPPSAEGGNIEISPELGSKLGLFMDRLQRWRQEARQGSLSDLIWRIYSETGYLIGLAVCPAASASGQSDCFV